jgi:hypothetical protein
MPGAPPPRPLWTLPGFGRGGRSTAPSMGKADCRSSRSGEEPGSLGPFHCTKAAAMAAASASGSCVSFRPERRSTRRPVPTISTCCAFAGRRRPVSVPSGVALSVWTGITSSCLIFRKGHHLRAVGLSQVKRGRLHGGPARSQTIVSQQPPAGPPAPARSAERRCDIRTCRRG